MMKKKNINNYQEAIKNLPEIVPDKNALWQRVDRNIYVDGLYHEKKREVLQSAINGLPDIDPEENIWSKIEEQITDSDNINLSSGRFIRYAAAIAAVVVISILLIIKPTFNKITYSKEIIELNNKPDNISNSTKQTEDLIAKLCSAQPVQCQNPDFVKLKTELDYLLQEKKKMSDSDDVFISNPEKIKYNEFIDKQIADLTNRIIEFLSI